MAQLHIRHESQTLRHGNVCVIKSGIQYSVHQRFEGKSLLTSIRLEHHHGVWTSRQHVPNHELGKDVEANLDVGDGLHHTDGDHPDKADHDGNEQGPPGEAGRPNVRGREAERQARYEDAQEPPLRDGLVLAPTRR